MAKITLEEYEQFETLPADTIVHLKVEETEIRKQKSRDGSNEWEKLSIKFKILGIQTVGNASPVDRYDSLIGSFIYGSVPWRFSTNPENKLKQWVEAILGMDLPVGFELDTDLLVNRKVRGITSTYDKRTTDPATGKPFQGQQVDSLLPAADSFAAQAAQPTNATAGFQQPAGWAQPMAQSGPVAVGAGGAAIWDDQPPF